ncbi:MAG: P63C domain-containing protein [Ignavibacteria bacterium]|nr:P63C domain-containing protein [Ignavibacteria bacterium]
MEEKSMQAKGGEARAKALSGEQRSEIAQTGAAARWNIPKATHEGPLQLADAKIQAVVLEDGTRLLTQSDFLLAIGRSRSPKAGTGATVAEVPTFLAANNLKPFIDNELAESTIPIKFLNTNNRIAYGYKAELLPKICDVYLKARDGKALLKSQEDVAKKCDMLVRGLAHVGINALVDEATGYQEVRDKLALQKILDMFISKELLKWTKRFPDEFYKELFRLKKWEFPKEGTSKPQVVGHYTNDIVYDRLAPSVLNELKRLNPPDEKGHRPHKHHQWLTPDIGHPKLRDHISGVIALMKSVEDWNQFKKILRRVYPRKKIGETIEMDM